MLKRITFICLIVLLLIGGVFSYDIAFAQAPPPADMLLRLPRFRRVRVNIKWTDRADSTHPGGVTREVNYYTIIWDERDQP